MNKFVIACALSLISLTGCGSKSQQASVMRVMSFNIRMDTPEDGDNRWERRKDFACEVLRAQAPDLIGAQEVLHHQLTDILERLPEYGYVGVGRIDGDTTGEYAAIFYNRERFDVLDSGNFWLSEDPSAVGRKGWDAACERIATWAKLHDRRTDKDIFMLNTHLDHVGRVARHESARLIKQRITGLAGDIPVLVTGDLNASSESEVVHTMLEPCGDLVLTDTRTAALSFDGPEYTFHDYGRIPLEQRPWLDYIFASGVEGVRQFSVITDTRGELYTSDHYPVIAVLEI